MTVNLKGSLISIYIVGAMLAVAFAGMLVLDGALDETGVEAATLVVDAGGGGQYTSIQAAIDNASSGDTIRVFDGVYNEDITINKTISLFGNGSATTELNGSGNSDVIRITSDWVNVSGFKISAFDSKMYASIMIYQSDNVIISYNDCLNDGYGIYLYHSHYNTIQKNICDNHSVIGVVVAESNNSLIENNTCTSNGQSGIEIIRSILNTVVNNECTSQNSMGIYSDDSDNNEISNNRFNGNTRGLRFLNSDNNNIHSNDFNNNTIGQEFVNSDSNIVYKNNVTNNSDKGIYIATGPGDGSQWNQIYHNNIINNTNQLVKVTPDQNTWDNGAGEGNFWSDYAGLDNGNGSRKAGDGIGDTGLPHQGVDDYPFMDPSGWNKVYAPTLTDPGSACTTGCYQLTWTVMARATDYIVEEDQTNYFTMPQLIYDGPLTSYNFINKNNGTYYYRVRAYSGAMQSNWSNSVDITVDWLPQPPTGLYAHSVAGHEVTLKWTPPPDTDIAGYNLFVNNTGAGSSGPYHKLMSLPGTISGVVITKLAENTQYSFRLSAYDGLPSISAESNTCTVTTLDIAPSAPAGLAAEAISRSQVKLTWTKNTEFDINGYHIYSTDAEAGPNDDYNLVESVSGNNNQFIVKKLEEEALYYFKIKAFDNAQQNSTFSEVAYARTLDETPPMQPFGVMISKISIYSITLEWEESLSDDVVGYNVQRAREQTGPFSYVNDAMLVTLEYKDDELTENTLYYYRVSAVDDAGLESGFSQVVSARTMLGPYPPKINVTQPDFSFPEDTVDKTINLNRWFSDPNNEKLRFWVQGDKNLEVSINLETGGVQLTPKLNWNGQETLTFYAKDNVHTEISDSVKITVSFVNDPPGSVEILKPRDGTEITEGDPITFEGYCRDVDEPYGDKLTYTWKSSKLDVIGTGKNLTTTSLTPGTHIINLLVTDSGGESSVQTINIKVKSREVITAPDDKSDMLIILFGILAIVIIIIVLVVLMVLRKRRYESETRQQRQPAAAEGFIREPQVPAQPQPAPAPQTPPEVLHVLPDEEVSEQVAWEPARDGQPEFGGVTRPIASGMEEDTERWMEQGADAVPYPAEEPGWPAAPEQQYYEMPPAEEPAEYYDGAEEYGQAPGYPDTDYDRSQEQPQDYYDEYQEQPPVEYTDQWDEVLTPEQQRQMYEDMLTRPPPQPQPVGYRVVMQPVMQPVYGPYPRPPPQQQMPPVYPPPQQFTPPPYQTQQPAPVQRPIFCGNCGGQMDNPFQCQNCGWQR